MTRLLWLAVGEARGHLNRARLMHDLLAPIGIGVDIVTTNRKGQIFLREAGLPAAVLPGHFRLCYDGRQNLLVSETRRAFERYLVRGLAADLAWLARARRHYALVVNDSFHPALLSAALAAPSWRGQVVNVYGEHLHHAALDGLDRPTRFLFERSLQRSLGNVVHTLDEPQLNRFALRPLIAAPREHHPAHAFAAVYLNPRFSDPRLADAIENAVASAGLALHAVGESITPRSGWVATDPAFADKAAAAAVLIAAPGMGTLSQAHAYGTPMVALVSDQPEQRMNLRYLPAHARRVFLESATLESDLTAALTKLPKRARHGAPAHQIQSAWRHAFLELIQSSAHTQPTRRRAA